MKEKWEDYALTACETIIAASLSWNGEYEEDHPELKRARTLAGAALRLKREQELEEEA
jgi:hypothetical protein